jgi:NAD(P)-dependent dehydrogenase (short-subunit alcohol dehydrogenase family)
MSDTHPVILVTGASRGLGRGIAVRLSELGMSVAVNFAGNAAAAEETVALCRKHQASETQKFIRVQGDVGAADDRRRIVAQTLDLFGRIDGLVNNAGMGPRLRADMTETSLESFAEVLRVNLEGPYFLTQIVARHWIVEQPAPRLPGGFKVVFNSSISAATASINRPEYCISKAGLAMASQLWAVRLAREGIQVYEVRPGIMATDMTASVKERYDRMFAEGVVPQPRWGTAEDVGKAVGALLQGGFPYSTGAIIHVDGGFHISRL